MLIHGFSSDSNEITIAGNWYIELTEHVILWMNYKGIFCLLSIHWERISQRMKENEVEHRMLFVCYDIIYRN